jgi:hypothetical protein
VDGLALGEGQFDPLPDRIGAVDGDVREGGQDQGQDDPGRRQDGAIGHRAAAQGADAQADQGPEQEIEAGHSQHRQDLGGRRPGHPGARNKGRSHGDEDQAQPEARPAGPEPRPPAGRLQGLEPPGLPLSRDQVVQEDDEDQGGEEGQDKGPVEAPGQGQLRIVALALVDLALERQGADPQHIGRHVALP